MKLLILLTLLVVLPLTTSAHSPVADIVEQAAPDVVVLQDLEGDIFCSGFLVKETGLIATAAHCLEQPFLVRWKKQLFSVKTVAIDHLQDVAFLRPTFGPLSLQVGIPLAPAPPKTGDSVIIIGNHLGWDHTVTTGIISNDYREMGDQGKVWVQTSAYIIGGASGGVALNEDGEIIGMVSFTMVDQNICSPDDPFCSPQYTRTMIGGLIHLDSIKHLLLQ